MSLRDEGAAAVVATEKSSLRAWLRAERALGHAARSLEEARRAAQGAAELLAAASFAALAEPSCAALYHPLPGELDPAPIGALLRERGARLCLPRVVRLTPPLLCFHLAAEGAALVPGRFGLQEPSADAPLADAPTVFVVPGLGFDRAGHRLGFGRGLYDGALRAQPSGLRVALCYPQALRPAIPHTEDDEPMDLIVTPQELIVTHARPIPPNTGADAVLRAARTVGGGRA